MDLNRDLFVLNKDGMVRPPDDGVQLETPQAQSATAVLARYSCTAVVGPVPVCTVATV